MRTENIFHNMCYSNKADLTVSDGDTLAVLEAATMSDITSKNDGSHSHVVDSGFMISKNAPLQRTSSLRPPKSHAQSPDTTTCSAFNQRPTSHSFRQEQSLLTASSPCQEQPISKLFKRGGGEGDPYFSMRSDQSRQESPFAAMSELTQPHYHRQLLHQDQLAAATFCQIPRDVNNSVYFTGESTFSKIPSNLLSASNEATLNEIAQAGDINEESQAAPRPHHRKMISSESLLSEQVSTTTLTMMDKSGLLKAQDKSQFGIVEEQAEVIRRMSERLGEMERKNEEYVNALRELTQKTEPTEAISNLRKATDVGSGGGVLVSALIGEMQQFQEQRENLQQALRERVSETHYQDGRIEQLNEQMKVFTEEFATLSNTSQANIQKLEEKNEEQELVLKCSYQKELNMKCMILDSLEKREAELLKVESQIERVVQRIQKECHKGRDLFKEDSNLPMKMVQIEEFIFMRENENSTTRRTDYELESLNKLRNELSVVKDRLQQNEGKNEDQLHKLKAENQRQRNYIELIEREMEMQRIMHKTKKLLTDGEEENRLRPSWETAQTLNFYKPRGSLGERESEQKRLRSADNRDAGTSGLLNSSYDSILSKLGNLQDQIIQIKTKERTSRPAIKSSGEISAHKISEQTKKKRKPSQKMIKVACQETGRPRSILKEKCRNNRTVINRAEMVRTAEKQPLKIDRNLILSSQGKKESVRSRSVSKPKRKTSSKVNLKTSVNRTFYGKENLLEAKNKRSSSQSMNHSMIAPKVSGKSIKRPYGNIY